MLEPILSVTYGCIVYQEQVIEIFRKLGRLFARAGRHGAPRDEQEKGEGHREGARARSSTAIRRAALPAARPTAIPVKVAEDIYDEMYDFANYAFNKAHSVCYAVIAYQTAWFKYYYPKEYMAALMTSVLDSLDENLRVYRRVQEHGHCASCRRTSTNRTTILPSCRTSIRFGLAAIKNIGRGFIQKVMQERENGGPFPDLEKLLQPHVRHGSQ